MPHYYASFAEKILGVKYRKIPQKRVKIPEGVEGRRNGARGATRPTNTGGYAFIHFD